MGGRRIYDDEKHIHFVTFSCFKRRRHLRHDKAKKIVIGVLGSRLSRHEGLCLGFVVMQDHVHAMIWFPKTGCLSSFMNKWKELSSKAIRKTIPKFFPKYWRNTDATDPIWQAGYYDFNIWSRSKVEEKLRYMHLNPVRAELTARAADWPWSSARWYLEGRSVGLPIRWPPGLELDDD